MIKPWLYSVLSKEFVDLLYWGRKLATEYKVSKQQHQKAENPNLPTTERFKALNI
jgi:hypothetical protein